VNAREVRVLGAIAASAVVGVGAAIVAATEPIHSAAGSTMQTGVTQTATTPPTAPAIGKAAPIVTGPAPLPVVEQGLPG
jgi:carbonic anhydrase/acetyltransferase-like protein (isoleucine patch superfamily)